MNKGIPNHPAQNGIKTLILKNKGKRLYVNKDCIPYKFDHCQPLSTKLENTCPKWKQEGDAKNDIIANLSSVAQHFPASAYFGKFHKWLIPLPLHSPRNL